MGSNYQRFLFHDTPQCYATEKEKICIITYLIQNIDVIFPLFPLNWLQITMYM